LKKIESSKLNSYLAVQTLFAANRNILESLGALDESSEELTENIMAIHTNVQVQTSPSGAAAAKQQALLAVGDLAYEIAGGVLSFAEKSDDVALAARVRISRTTMTAGSGNVISSRIQRVIDIATEQVESLGSYGVTQTKINSLKQRLKTYDAVRVLPRQAIAAAGAATRQLERLFPKADRLLKNRIDKLVWQFRRSEPEFYQKYQVARTIVNPATVSNGEPVPTVAAETTPVAKAA